jgi:hypothetical protein
MKTSYLLFFFILTCCAPKDRGDCHYKINFINNSQSILYVFYSTDSELTKYGTPDPRFNNESKSFPNTTNESALKFGNAKPQCGEDKFDSAPKLYVFVFDNQVLEANSWDDVKANNLYLKRYDLTLQDLKNSNWTITYP